MPASRLVLVAAGLLGLLLGGCISDTLDPVPESALKPRDRKLLASAPYLQVKPGQDWLRHVVSYSTKEKPGTVIIDTDKKFLYLVQKDGRAYRYGVTVGEDGMDWKGTAEIGRKV